MAIQDRNLGVETKLWARCKGATHTAEVVQSEQGLRYRLADGREFTSPSAAGGALTGHACNGWAFWTVGEPPEEAAGRAQSPRTEAEQQAVQATPKPEPRAKRGRKARTGTAAGKETSSQEGEGFACGHCDVVLPTAEAGTAHPEEVHSA